MEELLNKLKEINAIRAIGDYADYEPNGKHKDTIYFAEDEEKVYLNGKNYGGPNDEDLANILEDYAKISDLEIVELPSSVVNINRLFDDASGMGFSSDIVDELFSILNKAYNRNGLLKYVIKRQPQNGRNETIIFVITQSSWTIENGIEPKVNLFTVYNNVIYNFTVNPLNASFTRTKIEKVNISDETGNSTTSVMSQKACTDSFVQKEKGKQLSSNDFNNDYKEKLINTYTNEQVDNHLIQLGNNLRDYSESLAMGVYNDLNNSKVNKVAGKQLSTEDFTTLLKEKLEGLENYDDTEIQTKLTQLKNNLDTILDAENSTAVIDTFQEIENFLSGITNQETLTGLLQDLKSDILALCANTYVTKSTDEEISGNKTFTNSEGIVIKRNNGVAKIKFNSGNANVGAIGSDGDLRYWKESNSKWETVYHSGNDGSGSGLDADLLDGIEGNLYQKAQYTYYDTSTNKTLNELLIPNAFVQNPIATNRFTYIDTKWYGNVNETSNRVQIAYGYNKDEIYFRRFYNSSWADWKTIAFTDSNVASADKLTTKQLTNEDLNDVKDIGTIYKAHSSNTCANKPDGVTWFGLQVLSWGNSNDVIQIIYNDYNTYRRRCSSGTIWSNWQEIATTDSTVAQANKLTTKQLTNEDLNDIKSKDFISYTAIGSNTCANSPLPIGDAFCLQVYGHTSSSYVTQIVTNPQTGIIYKRFCNNNVWQPWQQLATTDGAVAKLTTKQLTNEDLDTIKDKDFNCYYANNNTCANTPINNSKYGFSLQVYRLANTDKLQILTVASTGDIYKRYFTGTTWTDWKKMLTENDPIPALTTKLLTNEDLNDIKDENFNSYYAKNNDCINVPDIDSYTGFGLQVFKTGNVFIVQILITFNGSIYKRAFNGTSETWSTWQQILSNDGVTGTANKLNVNYLALTDLNNVKTNYYEIYCCDAYSPYTNAPDNLKNFILHVIKGHNEVIQIITNYKKSYIRRYNGVGWTDWKKILDESDIQKTWVGTEAEYNAIETKDSNTIYYIKE